MTTMKHEIKVTSYKVNADKMSIKESEHTILTDFKCVKNQKMFDLKVAYVHDMHELRNIQSTLSSVDRTLAELYEHGTNLSPSQKAEQKSLEMFDGLLVDAVASISSNMEWLAERFKNEAQLAEDAMKKRAMDKNDALNAEYQKALAKYEKNGKKGECPTLETVDVPKLSEREKDIEEHCKGDKFVHFVVNAKLHLPMNFVFIQSALGDTVAYWKLFGKNEFDNADSKKYYNEILYPKYTMVCEELTMPADVVYKVAHHKLQHEQARLVKEQTRQEYKYNVDTGAMDDDYKDVKPFSRVFINALLKSLQNNK